METGDAVSTSQVQTVNASGYDYYTVTLDPSEVTTCRTIKLTWNFAVSGNQFSRADFIEVVNPLITPDEVQQAYPQFDIGGANEKSYDQIKAMERTVRQIIQTYTNQTFGPKGTKTLRVFGSGSNYLHLPERIYGLEYVAAEDPDITLYDQTASGGLLYKRDHDGVPVEPAEVLPNTKPIELVSWDKEHPWTIRRKHGRHPGPDPKRDITAGWLSEKNIFESKRSYVIRAQLGWEYVPNAVNQAAKVLIDDYMSNEAVYHERNVEDVSSADWSMSFGGDHFSTTGNVYADQLLAPYVNVNWVVI